MEAYNKRRLGTLGSLSEQQLVDCAAKANAWGDAPYGNLGCEGGWVHAALQYIYGTVCACKTANFSIDNMINATQPDVKRAGLKTEADYPYGAVQQECQVQPMPNHG